MIGVETLTDGGQPALVMARRLAAFLAQARHSLDIAVYDFALKPETAAPVTAALKDAAARGVAIRLAYNVDHRLAIPVPPPPRTDTSLIGSLGVPARGIPGIPDLMHHKFVVRDGRSIWTGSMNWTDDSWTREENVVAVVDSGVVAKDFTRDFGEIWSTGRVVGSGEFDTRWAEANGSTLRPWFSPGRGRSIARRIATAIARSGHRIRVASPVITAGPILATLVEVAAARNVDLAGVIDATQMDEVHRQWHEDPHASWKIPLFRTLLSDAPFSGKRSTPYGEGTVHDYMHAKVTVADDIVFIGSYNLSQSGEENAENVLEIRDGQLADRMAAFVDQLRTRYPAVTGWA